MPLRTIVFAEFRRLNLRAGYLWQAQHYLNLRCKLDRQYFSSFDSTIENLCKEGIL